MSFAFCVFQFCQKCKKFYIFAAAVFREIFKETTDFDTHTELLTKQEQECKSVKETLYQHIVLILTTD